MGDFANKVRELSAKLYERFDDKKRLRKFSKNFSCFTEGLAFVPSQMRCLTEENSYLVAAGTGIKLLTFLLLKGLDNENKMLGFVFPTPSKLKP